MTGTRGRGVGVDVEGPYVEDAVQRAAVDAGVGWSAWSVLRAAVDDAVSDAVERAAGDAAAGASRRALRVVGEEDVDA